MSRIAPLVLSALLLPAAAAAQSITAEEALATHQRTMAAVGTGCVHPVSRNTDEVVVCAKRAAPSLRLPLPVEPEPGTRIRGEAASATRGLEPQRCTAWGANQSCSGGLPIAAIAVAAAKGAAKIADAIINPD